MYRGGSRILPALIILAVVVIAIVALVAIGRAILGGGKQPVEEDTSAHRALVTTDADHSVRMTVRGPIVADENFRSYQIDISPTTSRLTTYSGYEYRTLENKTFSNNTDAYTEFVNALDRASFTKEVKLSGDEDDTRGICATGRLYTFEIMEAQSAVKTLWTTNCKGAAGSFKGDAVSVRSLFLRQIPGSDSLLRGINLS